MKHLTIRNVTPELARALEREKKRRGSSLNQTILDLLSGSLGVGLKRSNGLARLAGGWSEEEWREFEEATRDFERVDEELWR